MTEKESALLNKLTATAKRGRLAQEFLNSDFWKEHWKPEWDKTLQDFADSSWHPGDKRLMDEVAMSSAHMGGALRKLSDLKQKLDSWIKDGNDAMTRIDEISEREKKLSKARGFWNK